MPLIPDYAPRGEPVTGGSPLAFFAFVVSVCTTPLALRLLPRSIVREAIQSTGLGLFIFFVPVSVSLVITVATLLTLRRRARLRGQIFARIALALNLLTLLIYGLFTMVFFTQG